MPIGVIVALAIGCVVVAVVTSARRADEVALENQRALVQHALNEYAQHVRRQVQRAAESSDAVANVRTAYDPQWVDRQLLAGTQEEIVALVDGADRALYLNNPPEFGGDASALRLALAPIVDIMRGRLSEPPRGFVQMHPGDDDPSRATSNAFIGSLGDRPVIVGVAAVGSPDDLARSSAGAPLMFGVEAITDEHLQRIGRRLELRDLRPIADPRDAGDNQVLALADAGGANVARFAWESNRPGASIISSAVPFVAAALGGFAVLVGLVLRHMRRSSAAIAAGEQQLRHLAMHDPVCGLPNRIYFSERLEQTIRKVRAGGLPAAVFYIDLDHFKDVNDTLGHPIGDELILNVTQRLSRIIREDDLVARLGGDEFAIITTCASDSYSLQAIAGRIIAAVCAPYLISGHNIIIGASIGIAVIDRRAGDAADILRYADMALYRAKNEGRNRACIYDAAMDADLSSRKLLEGDLLHAIKNEGLRAVYQPIVNASGDTVVAVEALARWTHPTQGEIPPSRFIPIAEHSGLIVELGEWMLRRACLDGRDWPGVTVAVNVSPLQFRRSDFVDLVERILHETDFDANRLELELTESTLLGNLDTAELSMLRLKAIGVRFALDDFGTGYSSLLYLRRFPFDKLKIDSSFVRSIEKAPDAAAIVHAVVSLGRGLGMKVTAEGVETAEQHLFLRAAGVHTMQGYRFGRPGPASDLTLRLASPEDYRVQSPDLEVALAG